MKKSTTKNTTINRVNVEYKVMKRYALRVYNARHELPEDAQHMPSFKDRPGDSCFPIIWMDYENLSNPFANGEYFEILEIKNAVDDDILVELSDSELASGGSQSAYIASKLANKYGLLEVEYVHDDRGEPAEVWVALSKGLLLFLEINEELEFECSPAELRKLLNRFREISGDHVGTLASIPGVIWEGLESAQDDDVETLARQGIAQWVKNLIPRFLPNLRRHFELEVSVVNGQFQSRIVATSFSVALAFLLGRYLEGGSSLRRCKNTVCKKWFEKRRTNDEYGGIGSKGKKNCGVYNSRSQPCPYAREAPKFVTNP